MSGVRDLIAFKQGAGRVAWFATPLKYWFLWRANLEIEDRLWKILILLELYRKDFGFWLLTNQGISSSYFVDDMYAIFTSNHLLESVI